MLADKDAMATIAVKDLARARRFYQQTLGFSPTGVEGPGVVTLRSGASTIVVYETPLAGTSKATSATWGVGDEMDAIVRTLQQAGVRFEHYELPGMTRDGDVHVAGSFKAAWFKDPDGNILHINNG
jgi:catechol 2,3-dioxygenase-like lactoylglutathione lyase family enzyme